VSKHQATPEPNLLPSVAAKSETREGASLEQTLPMIVVDRSAAAVPSARGSRLLQKLMDRLRALRFVPLAALLIASGGLIGLYFQPPGLQKLMALLKLQPGGGTNHPIAVPVERKLIVPIVVPPSTVVGLGRLLPRGELITIAPPFGAGDARIASLSAKEGDGVKQGAVLAILDNERSLKAAVVSAQATIASRDASLMLARETVVASRAESQAALMRAEATVVNTKRDLDRVTTLRAKGFVADASYDIKRAAHDQAVQDVEKAKATLSRYQSSDADQQPDVLVARRNVDAARADLEKANAELDKAYVRAPMTGTVITIHARAGEKPGTAGIMDFGNIDEMTAELEVYQTQIGRVTTGASVEITADALPTALTGIVTRIGLAVGRQTSTDANPAANTDARVFKVYVALTPTSAAIARRFTNLQLTGRIATAAPGRSP
jgi:HlyD family secretion protein